MKVRFIAAGLSDVGLQREVNEDDFCIVPQHRLFVVADGMGGHRAGHVASRMASTLIVSFFDLSSTEDNTWPFHFDSALSVDENRLVGGIQFANKQIFDASFSRHEVRGMGTTVVSALFVPEHGKLYIAHVGDSRAYRLRDAELAQLTRDHSLVNDYLALMPDLTAAQREELPRNIITRALGMQDSVQVDLAVERPRPGDVYLLCTDGLTSLVEDEDIQRIAHASLEDPELAVRSLVGYANQRGGEDNITVIVVAFQNQEGE